jgi:hypothetical protein
MAEIDAETLDRYRTLEPRAVFQEVRDALYRRGAATSADFLEVYEELVAEGILTWEQIEGFEDEGQ